MEQRTTCVVVGGGPAGLMTALVLARAGVAVTVLEKHADFLRDFRGDTVHTSTMTLLDELGLWDRFATLPWKPMTRARVVLDAGPADVADLGRLRQPHPFIAMVPQWHLLDLLATAGAAEPTYMLRREAEVTDLVRDTTGRVAGVRWTDRTDGAAHTLAADLVIACDGRGSRVRAASGLTAREFDVPMDVWWFELPRGEGTGDPEGGLGRISAGRFVVVLDRGDHYQIGYLIPHGHDAASRSRPISTLQEDLRRLLPWLGDRVEGLRSWDDVKLLAVTLDRLTTWWAPGLLCIGDAAHTMSPAGGVGINLAVQDAVAAARLLAPVLRGGTGPRPVAADVDGAARRVQRRRQRPAALTQAVQRLVHRVIVRSALDPARTPGRERLPRVLRLLTRFPALQVVPARAVGVGVLPEHAPDVARRSPLPVVPPVTGDAAQPASAKNSSAVPSGSLNESAQP